MNKNFKACAFAGLLAALVLSFSQVALGKIHLSVSGSWAKNNLGLEEHTSRQIKSSLSVDLGSYFRIGYSYGQTFQHREGHMNEADEGMAPMYIAFEQDTLMEAHSIDLFAILYAGSIFTPYIFAGGALKYYRIRYEEENRDERENDYGPIPVPNYGCGLAISLNKDFSLKISNTWSTGVKEDLEGEKTQVMDSQFDVGLSYQI